jgi:hypothetical protein
MALSLSTIIFTTTTRNSLRDKLQSDIDAGTGAVLELYSSSTPGSGTLLAAIPLDATQAFTASSPGLLTADVSPTPTVNGAATGVPLSYQLKTQSAGTVICEGAVAGGDTINAGQPVNVLSFTITISA